MSELVKRTIFGALYVGVLVASILLSHIMLWAVLLVTSVLGVREMMVMEKAEKRDIVRACIGAGLMLATALCSAYKGSKTGTIAACGLIAIYVAYIFACSIAELKRVEINPIRHIGLLIVSQLWIVLPFAVMYLTAVASKMLLLMLFITVWVNDTGAYCVGMLTAKLPGGNHKMSPRLSPKKSWEGLIGGILFSIAAGCVFVAVGWGDEFGINATEMTSYIIAGVFTTLTAVAAVIGDLAESAVKRKAGVKDSGRFLPGHGGVLDRFDSMLFVALVEFVVVIIFTFVLVATASSMHTYTPLELFE